MSERETSRMMAHLASHFDREIAKPVDATPAPRVWKVTIERIIYVVADGEHEALLAGGEHEREAASDHDADDIFVEPATLDDTSPEWLRSIPYGSDDDRTVLQLLEEEAENAPPPRDTLTIDMFTPDGTTP